MKIIVNFCRIFVGALFIFSGSVKAIDPLGTSYKIGEYFVEFGMGFLEPLTLSFSVVTIVLEVVLGVVLLLGYRMKFTSTLLLLLILFFTFLTGYTTVTGNVTDCGCFGDFLKLKPIESFIKDLVLLVMILIIFWKRDLIKPIFSSTLSAGITGIATIGFTIYCFSNFYWDLPQYDFRPYKVGNNIPDQMTVPPDKQPVYEYKFIYKNNESGEEKEFDMNNLPKGDTWSFVDRKDVLVKEGETPKINNFQVVNNDGEDITEEIIYESNYLFMVVAYNLEHTAVAAFEEKLNPIAKECDKAGYKFFAVTSAGPEEREKFRHEHQTPYPFYEADAIFLKTIVRSNPGLMIVKDGVVIGKWHHKQIPTFEEIKSSYLK